MVLEVLAGGSLSLQTARTKYLRHPQVLGKRTEEGACRLVSKKICPCQTVARAGEGHNPQKKLSNTKQRYLDLSWNNCP